MEAEKDGMLTKLSKRYPLAIAEFKHWFVTRYQVDLVLFESAPFIERCREVLRFLGYSTKIDENPNTQQMVDFVKSKLSDYNNILLKYPSGPDDPLKIICNLAYSERNEYQHRVFEMNKTIQSFRDALVKTDILKRSFRDSLISNPVMKVTRVLIEDTFWEDIKKHNPRLHEKAPF